MPTYFFHLHDDLIALDEEGVELPNVDAARERAITNARELACSEIRDGYLNLKHRIEVADERRKIVLTVYFRDVVDIES